MKPWKLRQIYKQHGVKKKQIKVGKLRTRKVQMRLEGDAAEKNAQLEELEAKGYSILYADETMFTSRQVLKRAYSAKYQNLFLE